MGDFRALAHRFAVVESSVEAQVTARLAVLMEWLATLGLLAALATGPGSGWPWWAAFGLRLGVTIGRTASARRGHLGGRAEAVLSAALTVALLVTLSPPVLAGATPTPALAGLMLAAAATALALGALLPTAPGIVALAVFAGVLGVAASRPLWTDPGALWTLGLHGTGAGLPAVLAWVLLPGTAGSAVRRVLVEEATRVQAFVTGVLRDQAAAEQRARRVRARTEQQRLLHDTALNTLGAVGHGWLGPDDAALIRSRAGRDAEALATLGGPPPGDPGDLGESLRALAVDATSGRLQVTTDLEPDVSAPGHVARAVLAAAGEALTNAAKHAAPCRVVLQLRRHAGGIRLDIRDDGRGFEPGRLPAAGLGLRSSLVERLAEVGGRATIDSTPGSGTTVSLRWRPAGQRLATATAPATGQRPRLRCTALLTTFGLLYVTAAALVLAQAVLVRTLTVWDLAAGAVLAAATGLLLSAARRPTGPTGWQTMAFGLHAPVCVLLVGMPRSGCAVLGPSPAAAAYLAAAVVLVALLRPGRGGLVLAGVLASSWLLLDVPLLLRGEACGWTAVQFAGLAIAAAVAAGWFRRLFLRHARLVRAARSSAELTRLAVEGEQRRADDRAGLLDVLTATVLPTLRGLADGGYDPTEEEVRRRCRHDAVLLRGYVTALVEGHPLAQRILDEALRRADPAVPVAVHWLGPVAEWSDGDLDRLTRTVADLVWPVTAPAGGPVTITVIDGAVDLEVSIVRGRSTRDPEPTTPAHRAGPLHVMAEVTPEGQEWLRVRYQRPADPDRQPDPEPAGAAARLLARR